MQLLAIWFFITALVIVAALIWAFAPILVPLIAVAVGLGVLVPGIIWLARQLEKYRADRAPRGCDRGNRDM